MARFPKSSPRVILFGLIAFVPLGNGLRGQAFNDFTLAPHHYQSIEGRDAMSRLVARARAGEYDFGSESGLPLLRKLLADLNVPETSQVLVFSKTSLQKDLISPENPRALYFNEDTHVAWMPGGKVEIITFDPDAGGMFFIEEPVKEAPDRIAFTSPGGCFGCHAGAATNFLPGPLARSSYTSEDGRRLGAVRGHNRISHAVPFKDRWGGYFVTGAPDSSGHLGNGFAVRESGQVNVRKGGSPTGGNQALTSLAAFFDGKKYPRPDANVLPLLLFDHQIEAHNLIMEALYRARHAAYEAGKNGGEILQSTREGTDRAFDRLVRYLLFADEVPLSGDRFVVSEDFKRDFLKNRKTGSNGLSLKDLDLKSRLFSHRLSYMIYARSFEEAPPLLKDGVYDRLWKVLSPETPPAGYDYFEAGERERILSILRSTKNDLPPAWMAGQGAAPGRLANAE